MPRRSIWTDTLFAGAFTALVGLAGTGASLYVEHIDADKERIAKYDQQSRQIAVELEEIKLEAREEICEDVLEFLRAERDGNREGRTEALHADAGLGACQLPIVTQPVPVSRGTPAATSTEERPQP